MRKVTTNNHLDARPLHLFTFIFLISNSETLIIQKSINLDGNYSGIRIPQDLILKKSATDQEFIGSVSFANKLEVTEYVDIDQVNGIRLDTVCDMVTMPTDGFGPYGLEINGKRCYCYRIDFETLIFVLHLCLGLALANDSCLFNH